MGEDYLQIQQNFELLSFLAFFLVGQLGVCWLHVLGLGGLRFWFLNCFDRDGGQ